MKHQSGSPSAWKARREAYQKTSGPVSNPGDGRFRRKLRRFAARSTARIRAEMATADPQESR